MKFCVRLSPLTPLQKRLLTTVPVASVSYHNCTDKLVTYHVTVQRYFHYYVMVASVFRVLLYEGKMIGNKRITWLCPWFPKFAIEEFSVTNKIAIGYYILGNQVRSRPCVIHQIQKRSEDLSLNDVRFVETLLWKYKLFLSAKIGDPIKRIHKFSTNNGFISNFLESNGAVKQFPYRNPTILQ